MKSVWEIYVPTTMLRKRHGRMEMRPIHTRFHRIWDKKVVEIAGGISICRTKIKGRWIDLSGYLFEDEMIPVRIVCTDDQIRQIAELTRLYYHQRAVMYYRISNEVYIE